MSRNHSTEPLTYRALRAMVVFGVAGACSLVTFQLAGGGSLRAEEPALPIPTFSLGSSGYHLGELSMLRNTMYRVDENYVDPSRIDWDGMYGAALQAVEQRVPATMFRREPGGQLVHVEIGSTRGRVLQVPPITSQRELVEQLQQVAKLLETDLDRADIPMDDLDEGDPFAQVEYAMINGILGTLDPHSRLLQPESAKEMDTDNAGEFGGLGITIEDRQGKLTVEYPLPDTPAERAGVRADDRIVRIDGESTINMALDEAVDKLRGRVGEPVSIEIMRDGLTAPLKLTIVRAKIALNPIEGTLMDGGIGYVAVQGYNAKVEEQLVDLLARLERDNGNRPLAGLVIDLRGNPGGYLAQAEKMSDIFLDHGTIVSQVDANGRKLEEYEARASGNEPKYPIVVLVNASSASASEIVSGALRNNERAVIIGQRTYGKGSVQTLTQYDDGSKLKLTISKYLTPGDRSIQAVGIPADIELVPTVAEQQTVDGKPDDIVWLYASERARREADSDKHLEQVATHIEQPSYSLRYLRPAKLPDRTSAQVDVSHDFEVQFAREVLLAAPGPRRADILAAAAPVVQRYQKKQNTSIVDAMKTLGIDWTDGATPKAPSVEITADLGDDHVIVAGKTEPVRLTVKNTGTETLYRVSAVLSFEGDYTPREFVFGALAPGQSREWTEPVDFVDGHPTELAPVSVSVRDASAEEIASEKLRMPVQGRALPELAWTTVVSDAAPGGDGDGVIEIGETLGIDYVFTNVGKGPTGEAFARLKNKAGKALDIERGTLEIGEMRNPDGTPCAVTKAAVGDDPPEYAAGCARTLNPGESFSGAMKVTIKEEVNGGLDELGLEVGDGGAYDHASIVRNGFYGYFTQHLEIDLGVGQRVPVIDGSTPPRIEVTDAPELAVGSPMAHVSGIVADDTGIAHVEIWSGDDKVFFQGAVKDAHVKNIPYTADITLKPGSNTITILATDEHGYTDTRSVVAYYEAPELAAQVEDIGETLPALHRD